ncbi:5418_t:CDS:2 [Paraglomus occultum]|uniref:5418_t:CDS:1 n=1 Tax=Paraglomus occultum TaxID=144539 RepID=A0A9N9C4M0_9GLOM|nr:5418_t:CDS:2 [Paraglomus occultum]
MKWKGGFVCEFIEIESEKRHDRDQGGGVHGNAIFSKYDLDFRVLDHKHQPFDWDKDGDKLNEPRKGRRVTLVAEIKTSFGPPILCYCVHLEVFCGLIGRVNQFSEILSDSVIHASTHPYQLILGDLNTKSHSIARLSSFSRDRYCVLSLGMSESEWWDKNLLSWHACSGDTNVYLQYVLTDARNPGFYDPWHPSYDVTMKYPKHYALYSAKLDWTLVRGFDVINRWKGNDDYSASDHKYLMVEVVFDDYSIASDTEGMAWTVWQMRRKEWKKRLEKDVESKRARGGKGRELLENGYKDRLFELTAFVGGRDVIFSHMDNLWDEMEKSGSANKLKLRDGQTGK